MGVAAAGLSRRHAVPAENPCSWSGRTGPGAAALMARLGPRLEVGRAIRAEARAIVARRGRLAEAVAWIAARDPGLGPAERDYREGVALRVSRMFAFVGIEHQH